MTDLAGFSGSGQNTVAYSCKYGNEQLDSQLAEEQSDSPQAHCSTQDVICTPAGGIIHAFEHLTTFSRGLQEINTVQAFKS